MIKRIFICWVVLVSWLSSSAQWQSLNLNNGYGLIHVSFNSDSVGIIASPLALMITYDLGVSWDTIYYNPANSLGDVHFVNDTTIFMDVYPFSGSGFLAKSFDLGNTWNYVNMAGGKIHFVSPQIGFSTTPFYAFRTTDGGVNWGGTNAGSGGTGNIHFVNDTIGYIAANYPGAVSVTTNGGDSWQTQPAIEGLDIFAPSTTTAYMVGWFADIQKTTNTGVTWNTLFTGVNEQFLLHAIYCTDENTCYVVGDYGTIIKTTDGGATWIPQYSGTTQKLFSVWCMNANTCFAVGDSGTVLRTSNGGVGVSEEVKDFHVEIFPNPSYNGIFQIQIPQHSQLTVTVFNVSGQEMLNKSNFTGGRLNLSSLDNGLYYVRFSNSEGYVASKPVLIVK